MNKMIHSSLVMIVVAMVIYAGFTVYSGGTDVFQAIGSLSISMWLLILTLSLLNYVLRYWRWHLYIAHTTPGALSHFQHLAIYIAGFAFTMTPGKTGEAMRTLYLKQYGVKSDVSLGAFFVERLMDLLTILLLAAVGLSFLGKASAVYAGWVTLAVIVAIVLFVKFPKQRFFETKFFHALPNKLQASLVFMDQMFLKANDLLSFKLFVLGLTIGVVAWGVEGYGLFLVMGDFATTQAEVQTTILMAITIYAAGVLLGAVSFLPGGLGGTEAAMIFMLTKVGFDMPSATAITFICRLATLWFAVLLGLIAMLLLSKIGLKMHTNVESVGS